MLPIRLRTYRTSDIPMNTDLTAAQSDYAIYLPAISSFYSTFVGRQRYEEYVPKERWPAGIPEMEMLNFFNPDEGLYHYQWGLYSAGHVNLDLHGPHDPKEAMIRERAKHTTVLADSGGFQIAKGVWTGQWNNPNDKEAEKRRSLVFDWLCNISNYSMTLDIPTWAYKDPEVAKKIGIYSYNDAVEATKYNNEYFIKNRFGDAKFLNVLQGSNHAESDHWYEEVKDYSNPDKYENHFNGWSMGAQSMCDIHLILKRIVTLIYDGLLEEGVHDWMHFLGTSKLEWSVLFTDIQRAVREHHNANFTISFDAASPFLATRNAQIYTHTVTDDRKKWRYHSEQAADSKTYCNDNRKYRDAVLEDKINKRFDNSPISEKLLMSDICHYAPGDLNKMGNEGKTSWDTFAYLLMMSHNVWHHINSVQEANRQYDAGMIPGMLINDTFNVIKFRDLVQQIFSAGSKKKSLEIIENNSRFWQSIIGTRGFTGKKVINASTQFNALFE